MSNTIYIIIYPSSATECVYNLYSTGHALECYDCYYILELAEWSNGTVDEVEVRGNKSCITQPSTFDVLPCDIGEVCVFGSAFATHSNIVDFPGKLTL
jgi:hypothetical protein